jgi:glucosylceramidase
MKGAIFIMVLLVTTTFFATKSKTTTKYFSTKGKAVHVHTSAEGTRLRLTKTDNLQFTDLNQPLKQLCVLLIQLNISDPFWALRCDYASAEVFAKLTKKISKNF